MPRTSGELNPDKRANFVRLASARAGKAITSIRSLKGLLNKSSYDYTATDWERIVAALASECETLNQAADAALLGKKVAKEDTFRLE